jgi:hypothetical protein
MTEQTEKKPSSIRHIRKFMSLKRKADQATKAAEKMVDKMHEAQDNLKKFLEEFGVPTMEQIKKAKDRWNKVSSDLQELMAEE